jgi:hypothetical protein
MSKRYAFGLDGDLRMRLGLLVHRSQGKFER